MEKVVIDLNQTKDIFAGYKIMGGLNNYFSLVK
jgi:hypothetical protein